MIRRRTGGPASIAGPLLFCAALLASDLVVGAWPSRALATDWIPPPRVTALFPGASLQPGAARTLTLSVRANVGAANLAWSVTSGGSFVTTVSPASGVLAVPANTIGTVNLSVTVPALAVGTSTISIDLVEETGGARVAKVSSSILAATGGRPEVIPVPSTWTAPAGTLGPVSFQLHSLTGSAEYVLLTAGRYNPDPNNSTGTFVSGSGPPDSISIPGGGTVTVNVPTKIPGNAYAGNCNAVQLSVTSDAGVSSALGNALASAALPDSLPTALIPSGVIPFEVPAAGRDGPVYLASRGVWLVPCGTDGVHVIRQSALDSIGMIDANGDGGDDRIVGTIRIPSYAAALSILPGFVTAAGETLDVGLLAAGRGGLMLLDLRVVETPTFGTWEDFFDTDGNGIDDRILRSIPTPGFATDAAWVRSFVSGRYVALVADADTGSVPVAATYNPALIIAGTGAGIVAVDVDAAIDSLGGVPTGAGTLPTQGSALDIELRGGVTPEMLLADGSGGVALYDLSIGSGAPATVTFSPRGAIPLSGMWGAPDARDLAWIPNTIDSTYAALAASNGGVQIVRVPRGTGSPSLVFAQQTSAPAVGIAGAWTGTLAVALRTGGVALMRSPGGGELNQIQPGAPAPYTQPVNVARLQTWASAGALERALHRSWQTSATSLALRQTPGALPDVVVSDGARLLVLKPGAASITGVSAEGAVEYPRGRFIRSITPNPSPARHALNVRALVPSTRAVSISLYSVTGRRLWTRRFRGLPAGEHDFAVDVPALAAGVYLLRYEEPSRRVRDSAKVVILK